MHCLGADQAGEMAVLGLAILRLGCTHARQAQVNAPKKVNFVAMQQLTLEMHHFSPGQG
jgi:hypothetical protein